MAMVAMVAMVAAVAVVASEIYILETRLCNSGREPKSVGIVILLSTLADEYVLMRM